MGPVDEGLTCLDCEQVQDWADLETWEQVDILTTYGLDAAPESERWRWKQVGETWVEVAPVLELQSNIN